MEDLSTLWYGLWKRLYKEHFEHIMDMMQKVLMKYLIYAENAMIMKNIKKLLNLSRMKMYIAVKNIKRLLMTKYIKKV